MGPALSRMIFDGELNVRVTEYASRAMAGGWGLREEGRGCSFCRQNLQLVLVRVSF